MERTMIKWLEKLGHIVASEWIWLQRKVRDMKDNFTVFLKPPALLFFLNLWYDIN